MMLNWLRLVIISIIPLAFAVSCGNTYFSDYTKLESGVLYKLHRFGNDTIKAKPGNYIDCHLTYQTIDDSIFFIARRTVLIMPSEFKGSIDECFTMLAEGDSASFIISADHFFEKSLESKRPPFLAPNSKFKVSIFALKIKTKEDFIQEKEDFLTWINDFGEYEQRILKSYLENDHISINPTSSGLYPRFIKKGNGRKVKNGDVIIVHFEGRFLNGKIFDSTWKRNEPFSFVYGQEWQVIQGLEEGIGMMDEQSKAIFILPSQLAFGSKGSSTGIISPFTTLVFEVELVEIK